jgi:hypothetical protein
MGNREVEILYKRVGMLLFAAGLITIVLTPVILYTGQTTVTTQGVEESEVFTGVDSEVTRSPFSQPTLTVHVALGKEVGEVISSTVAGETLDTERLDMQTTSVKIQCEPNRRCMVKAYDFEGNHMDTIVIFVDQKNGQVF